MSRKGRHHQIDYVEFGATELEPLKQFYADVFGWAFTDYSPSYTSFQDGRLEGGFTTDVSPGSSPLVVLYSGDLEATYDQVTACGGRITKEIFDFPGGRRFQFTGPGGNELAVWSD